jgi:Fe-S-cluster containining protein
MTEMTPLAGLERQLERGTLFTHTVMGQNALRLSEVESFTFGLLDVLLAKGIVSREEMSNAVETVRQESIARGEMVGTGVALRIDEPEMSAQPFVEVNCGERMHVCHSICCKLDFPLTAEEVETGAVRWDLGRPYSIRHEADGYCTHRNRATGACGVYENRPAICRGYSCARDSRIWKDFDGMVLNTEWLEENLSKPHSPHMAAAALYQIQSFRERAVPNSSEAEPNP